MSDIERETQNSISKYEAVIKIIEKGYQAICQNHSSLYDYIDSIKETNPRTAVALELRILEQVPMDNSIVQEMARLNRLYDELTAAEKEAQNEEG